MKMVPKISIITPSFNSAKFIEQAIESVLIQNYSNFEHIIVDGGSTDGTIGILKKYPHLKWVSEPDRGQSHAMNKGFAMSTGDIIVYLNADDFFEPSAFYTVINYIDKEKSIFFVAGELYIIDEEGNKRCTENTKVTLFEMLHWWESNPFPSNSVSYFYYREVQEEVGGFDEDNMYSLDYDFLLKVVIKYKIKKIDEKLGNFRFIKGTKTHSTQGYEYLNIKNGLSKKYWKYLNKKQKILIFASYIRNYNPTVYYSIMFIKKWFALK
jgi:glycosyltransferase involved in cell wall biosynthesis